MASLMQLPNGLSAYALNRANAILIYEDVFQNQEYLRHGISIKDGDCIFDVGANIGLFLLLLNQRLRKGSVFCFEPIPEIFDVLKRNAELHNKLELHLFNIGLAKATGSAPFAFFPKSPADSSMCPDDSESARAQQRSFVLRVLEGKTHIRLNFSIRMLLKLAPPQLKHWLAEKVRTSYMASRPIPCPVRNLSEIIEENQVERIDLLKMDVEGAEFDILAGLRPGHWPRLRQVVMEVHGGSQAAATMCSLLEGKGFSTVHEFDPLRPNNYMVYARHPDETGDHPRTLPTLLPS